MQHVDFSVQTLWTLAHVQESPMDKIYVLLMIFIGPLAQSSGKLPRNLKESCFQLVVRMWSVIKFRKGMVEAKIHLFRYYESNQPYNCDFFCLLFLRLWNFVLSEYSSWKIIFNSLNKCYLTHLCVFVYIMGLHNVIKWLIWSTAFFFPTEWMISYIFYGTSGKALWLY